MSMFTGRPVAAAVSKNESIVSSVAKMTSTSVNYMHLPQKLPLKTNNDDNSLIITPQKIPNKSLSVLVE